MHFYKIYIRYFAGFELRSRYHKVIFNILKLPIYCIYLIPLLIVRIIRPIILIRMQGLVSDSIGHFIENTELYCCEKKHGINVPKQKNYIDIFYFDRKPYCNKQLNKMWKREIIVLPRWIFSNLDKLNRIIPGGKKHIIGSNTQGDRDVHNLYEKYSPHISFNSEEAKLGELNLVKLGVPRNKKFVCLIVRDSAYLKDHIPWFKGNYHDHRNSDIKTYKLVAEKLTELGYIVIRMGAKVEKKLNIENNNIIDYANSKMRSEFMDIYLGSKCYFCISTHTGFDGIAQIFQRPIVFTNLVPIGLVPSWCSNSLVLFKNHYFKNSEKKLSLDEIFKNKAMYFTRYSDYEKKEIHLKDNSKTEILDVVMEMIYKLNNEINYTKSEQINQKKFKKKFANWVKFYEKKEKKMHGEINIQYSNSFMNNNPEWLD